MVKLIGRSERNPEITEGINNDYHTFSVRQAVDFLITELLKTKGDDSSRFSFEDGAWESSVEPLIGRYFGKHPDIEFIRKDMRKELKDMYGGYQIPSDD